MRPFFHSLLLSFRGIFYTLTGKNIAFANLQMGVVSKLWKFVTGFSIKIWLKFFGAVFLQPCFFAPKSFAVIAKRADPKRSALFYAHLSLSLSLSHSKSPDRFTTVILRLVIRNCCFVTSWQTNTSILSAYRTPHTFTGCAYQ